MEELGQREGSFIKINFDRNKDDVRLLSAYHHFSLLPHCGRWIQDEGWYPAKKYMKKEDEDGNQASQTQHQAQQFSKETMTKINELNRKYFLQSEDLQRELAYRKVVDKMASVLGSCHPHHLEDDRLKEAILIHRSRASCSVSSFVLHGSRLHGCDPFLWPFDDGLIVLMLPPKENELYPEAEAMIKRVLSIQKRERGPFSVATATTWGVLGDLCLRTRYDHSFHPPILVNIERFHSRKLDDAARLLGNAIELKREILGTLQRM